MRSSSWIRNFVAGVACCLFVTTILFGQQDNVKSGKENFKLTDIFELEFVSDPQVSPDGKQIAYLRNFHDIMTDRRGSHIWLVDENGENTPLLTGEQSYHSPRWSPDGKRLLYVALEKGSAQVFCYWLESGRKTSLTRLRKSPSSITWSPDGKQVAFTMAVEAKTKPFVSLPAKPSGAKWAEPPRMIDRIAYRSDGRGYLPNTYNHVFVLPAIGGTPRQLTSGDFQHRGPLTWTPDSKQLLFSANRNAEPEFQPRNSDIFSILVDDSSLKQLTKRDGPDGNPVVTPDGKKIVYVGYDDEKLGHQNNRLYTMNLDGSDSKQIAADFPYSFGGLQWSEKDNGVLFMSDQQGQTHIGFASLDGKVQNVMTNIGGTSLGRPYGSGSYSVSKDGTIAFTHVTETSPSKLARFHKGHLAEVLVDLNKDLFAQRRLGQVEEIRYKSKADGQEIQGWIVKPPQFEAGKKYPLILEIHGGPYANYGPRFAAEIQLFAAAGYVVLYTNPRGSTSYGEDFANLIQHNYPGQDYDDLMSGVDAVISKGYVDENNLFVTGGSGGGVLTSWIVGKTHRFQAAVVAKPVINWYSFALTADMYIYANQYWFPGKPWEHAEHYMKRSPISLVGNVKTPTMLLTGEADYRTPISESEQYYQALQLQKVKSAMVRIPGASHGITARPSHLIAKVAYILKWFETHKNEDEQK